MESTYLGKQQATELSEGVGKEKRLNCKLALIDSPECQILVIQILLSPKVGNSYSLFVCSVPSKLN